MRRGSPLLLLALLGCTTFGQTDGVDGGGDGGGDGGSDADAGVDAALPSQCDDFERPTPVGKFWSRKIGTEPKVVKGQLEAGLESSPPTPSSSQLETNEFSLQESTIEVSGSIKLAASWGASGTFTGRIFLIDVDGSPTSTGEVARLGVRDNQVVVYYRSYLDDGGSSTITEKIAGLAQDDLSAAARVTFRVVFAPQGHITLLLDGVAKYDKVLALSTGRPRTFTAAIGVEHADGSTPKSLVTFDDVCVAHR